MIDTKQMAKYIFEEYANCYSEVDIEKLAKHLDGIKSEAIKEFAERLKFELEIAFDEPIFDTITGKIIESTIDKLLNELTYEPTKIDHNSLCETETYESR